MAGIVIGTMIGMLMLVAAGTVAYLAMTGTVPGLDNKASTDTEVVGPGGVHDDGPPSTRRVPYAGLHEGDYTTANLQA